MRFSFPYFILALAYAGFAPGDCIAQNFANMSDVAFEQLTVNANGCFAGCGVSFFDFDEDGLDDLTFGAFQQDIQILRNTGNGFELYLSLENEGEAKSVIWVDYDNDGDNDLFVGMYQEAPKLYNNQDMVLTNVSPDAGLPQLATQENYGCSWADYDRDGYLDLYIGNYNSPQEIDPPHNYLLRNLGNGTFEDVTVEAGVSNGIQMTLGSSWFDFNHDGWLDLHVFNDREDFPNALYQNHGDGTFTDVAEETGTDFSIFAMSSTVGDYDNDGWLDLYVTNGPIVGNYLLRNDQGISFESVAADLAVQVFDMCWSAQWIDYNNDGWQDLYVAVRDWDASPSDNHFYVNNEGTFSDSTGTSIFSDDDFIGWANAIGDWDNNGYPDLIQYADGFGQSPLWTNSGHSNNWIKLDLTGTVSNRNAIGSWIDVYSNGIRQVRQTYAGEDYLAQDSQYEIVGLGTAEIIDSLQITWPNGLEEKYYNIEPNNILELIEGHAPPFIEATDGHFCPGEEEILSSASGEEILWSTGESASSIAVSSPGWYWGQFTNSLGVTNISDSVFISLVFPPAFDVAVTHISCYGEDDGSIQFIDYSTNSTNFIWEDGTDGDGQGNLPPGDYSILVSNEFCSLEVQSSVLEPDSLTLSIEVQNPTCHGNDDGHATIEIDGGTPEYEVMWSAGPENLAEGNYFVEVIDNNQCTHTQSFEIIEPAPLDCDFNIIDNGNGSFTIQATPDGGTPPYQLDWSTGETGEEMTCFCGDFSVMVTDSAGCLIELTVVIPGIGLSVEYPIDIFPNPANNILTINYLQPENATILVFNSNGALVYDEAIVPGLHRINTESWANGAYLVKLIGMTFELNESIVIEH